MVGIIGAWYFGPKVTSAKKFKALRALSLFALKVLPGHGWGIAGVWLGPSPTNFSTPPPSLVNEDLGAASNRISKQTSRNKTVVWNSNRN